MRVLGSKKRLEGTEDQYAWEIEAVKTNAKISEKWKTNLEIARIVRLASDDHTLYKHTSGHSVMRKADSVQ